MEYVFNGTISNPASVKVVAASVEEAKRLLDEGEFEVSTQHTHHIVEFVADDHEPEARD